MLKTVLKSINQIKPKLKLKFDSKLGIGRTRNSEWCHIHTNSVNAK